MDYIGIKIVVIGQQLQNVRLARVKMKLAMKSKMLDIHHRQRLEQQPEQQSQHQENLNFLKVHSH